MQDIQYILHALTPHSLAPSCLTPHTLTALHPHASHLTPSHLTAPPVSIYPHTPQGRGRGGGTQRGGQSRVAKDIFGIELEAKTH